MQWAAIQCRHIAQAVAIDQFQLLLNQGRIALAIEDHLPVTIRDSYLHFTNFHQAKMYQPDNPSGTNLHTPKHTDTYTNITCPYLSRL